MKSVLLISAITTGSKWVLAFKNLDFFFLFQGSGLVILIAIEVSELCMAQPTL